MHACVERAGVEVLFQLLSSGADLSLEDRSGSSALVYAISAEDQDALQVLLKACKARGKEVIIITTDKLPTGRQLTKQYLNVPPPPDLEERLHCVPKACMSPSEIKVSPYLSSWTSQSHCIPQDPNKADHFKPGSPIEERSPLKAPCVARLLHLQRLHSEPWLNIPPSLLQQSKASSLTEELLDITHEEELSFGFMSHQRSSQRPPAVARYQSMNGIGVHRSLDRPTEADKERIKEAKWLSRKMSYDGVLLPHSASHQNLLNYASGSEATDRDPNCLPNLAVSSLQNVVRRRNIGMDHYSSDSQLPQFRSQNSDEPAKAEALSEAEGPQKRKLVSSRSSTLSGSRESLESIVQRRSPAMMERRGSGALLLDHISQTRPGYLPPLNPHAPIPDIKVNQTGTGAVAKSCSGSANVPIASGQRHFMPCAPSLPRDLKSKKTLLRRHSMQTEQIKHLANFEEIFGQ